MGAFAPIDVIAFGAGILGWGIYELYREKQRVEFIRVLQTPVILYPDESTDRGEDEEGERGGVQRTPEVLGSTAGEQRDRGEEPLYSKCCQHYVKKFAAEELAAHSPRTGNLSDVRHHEKRVQFDTGNPDHTGKKDVSHL